MPRDLVPLLGQGLPSPHLCYSNSLLSFNSEVSKPHLFFSVSPSGRICVLYCQKSRSPLSPQPTLHWTQQHLVQNIQDTMNIQDTLSTSLPLPFASQGLAPPPVHFCHPPNFSPQELSRINLVDWKKVKRSQPFPSLVKAMQ